MEDARPNRMTRPTLSLRVFTHAEQYELRRLAEERRTTVNDLLAVHLGPLRKQLQARLQRS